MAKSCRDFGPTSDCCPSCHDGVHIGEQDLPLRGRRGARGAAGGRAGARAAAAAGRRGEVAERREEVAGVAAGRARVARASIDHRNRAECTHGRWRSRPAQRGAGRG